jgi:hypothetical protein
VVTQKPMGEISGGGSREAREEIDRTDAAYKTFVGRYEMTAAAKYVETSLWGVPEGRRSPKGRSVGTGRALLALEVAANAIQEAGLSTRDDGGLKRQLAPSSTAGSRGQGPTSRSTRGLASYALSAASPSSMERKQRGGDKAGSKRWFGARTPAGRRRGRGAWWSCRERSQLVRQPAPSRPELMKCIE